MKFWILYLVYVGCLKNIYVNMRPRMIELSDKLNFYLEFRVDLKNSLISGI